MFYRTYRPQTITQLDNAAARETLTNLLRSSVLPHAFLFVGQKGMGKTSAARIFAKAVNCQRNGFATDQQPPSDIEPCNQCDNCLAITAGQSPDVIEQDAASNRGIDEIRSLIRESSYAPMSGRYRVFIIDEAHMITTDAFNALLKTLEEPPSRVLFILATTNEEKVPDTIQSRCVRVPFGIARSEDIVGMLRRILENESKELPDELLTFLAEASDYSFRDATKMLEEVLTQQKTTLEAAQEYFGVRSHLSLLPLLEGREREALAQSLAWVEQFHSTGGNTKRLLEDLLGTLQKQLLQKTGAVARTETTATTPETSLKAGEIAHLMKLLQEAYATLRTSPIRSIPLEIALVEFYNGKTKRSTAA